jgi:hypothetical protein
MTVHDVAIDKIRQLPEALAQEVNDFVDFLLMRSDNARWQLWTQFAELLEIGEADFSSYLTNLEDYESRLARGDIQW